MLTINLGLFLSQDNDVYNVKYTCLIAQFSGCFDETQNSFEIIHFRHTSHLV